MPHVSKHKLSKKALQDIEEQTMLFLSTTSAKTRQIMFGELFTPTERLMVAKRLAMILFTTDGIPTHEISKRLRVSPSTVARFEQKLATNRFRETKRWLTKNRQAHKVLRYIADLVSVPFDAQKKSLHRAMEEKL